MSLWTRILLIGAGLFPLLGLLSRPPDTMLLIFSIFVLVCFVRDSVAKGLQVVSGRIEIQLLVLFLVSGVMTEFLAWLNNYLKEAEEPALFHPQLIPDLIIGVGFYGGWALAWGITLRWFRFRVVEAFLVTGFQGIFFEQLGAVFRVMMAEFESNPLLALILGFYVFVVHGSIVGLALSPLVRRLADGNRSRHWIRFPLVILLMVSFAFLGCWLVVKGADVVGGLPPKRSIVEHPFW